MPYGIEREKTGLKSGNMEKKKCKAEANETKKEEKTAWDVWVESTLQRFRKRE